MTHAEVPARRHLPLNSPDERRTKTQHKDSTTFFVTVGVFKHPTEGRTKQRKRQRKVVGVFVRFFVRRRFTVGSIFPQSWQHSHCTTSALVASKSPSDPGCSGSIARAHYQRHSQHQKQSLQPFVGSTPAVLAAQSQLTSRACCQQVTEHQPLGSTLVPHTCSTRSSHHCSRVHLHPSWQHSLKAHICACWVKSPSDPAVTERQVLTIPPANQQSLQLCPVALLTSLAAQSQSTIPGRQQSPSDPASTGTPAPHNGTCCTRSSHCSHQALHRSSGERSHSSHICACCRRSPEDLVVLKQHARPQER
jgi:hypothetical protein